MAVKKTNPESFLFILFYVLMAFTLWTILPIYSMYIKSERIVKERMPRIIDDENTVRFRNVCWVHKDLALYQPDIG